MEYVDAFGRQRLCLRKDLPTLKEMEAAAGIAPRVELPQYQHPLYPEAQTAQQEVRHWLLGCVSHTTVRQERE